MTMVRLGYSKYLSFLGRHIRDFLLNLDNFHDYLKFTFPRMKAPSFFIEQETENSGLISTHSFPRFPGL